MLRKTLISLAVASTLGLTGCFSDEDVGANANPDPQFSDPAVAGKTWPIFNPVISALPLPNDLIFDTEAGDGTFDVTDSRPPVTTALNELSGASTVAPMVIQTNGQLDPATVVADGEGASIASTVHLVELAYASGDPVQGLSLQEPPTLELAVSGPGNRPKIRADVETLDGTSAIRILPLEPLNPRKRYIVVITKGVKDINGDPIIQDPIGYNNLTDESQGLVSPALEPVRALVNGFGSPWRAAILRLSVRPTALTILP